MFRRRHWTAAEVQRLRQEHADPSLSWGDIASIHGRTVSAVVQFAAELKLGRKPRVSKRKSSAELQAARDALAFELAEARADRDKVEPYKPGPLEW